MGNNVHEGHRLRLKERFLREGLDGFEKHNILELLLFYTIPRKDTNEIAHALLKRFGSIRGVFEAGMEDLCSVNGIGEHTASLIKLVPAVWAVAASDPDSKECYNSLNKIGKLLVKRYAGITVETVLLVLLDANYHIIDIVKLGEGSVNQVKMEMRKLVGHVVKTNASKVVLAHNHPGGTIIPSSDDIVVTEDVANTMRAINVDFLDHLLVAGDQYDALLSKSRGVFWQRGNSDDFYRGE